MKGRIEIIPVSKDYTLMIDYAHNAMALKSLLTTLKSTNPKDWSACLAVEETEQRADDSKWEKSGGELADLTVITSDNPRFEEPLAIIADIRTGIEKTSGSFIEIPDRKEAIAYVIHHAQPGDIIVAGKRA